ncbi:hypothetical protein PFISCL1PPCAC_21720, partial [Pristionchus fissidentatus]
ELIKSCVAIAPILRHRSVFTPEADFANVLLACSLVEHAALGVGRAVQMEGDGGFGVGRILHTMHAHRTIYERYFVLLARLFIDLHERRKSTVRPVLGEVEFRLHQVSFEHFDETRGARVVMHAGTRVRSPAENEQIELAVAAVHEIASVRASFFIENRIFVPLFPLRCVAIEQSFYLIRIHSILFESSADFSNELIEVHCNSVSEGHRNLFVSNSTD